MYERTNLTGGTATGVSSVYVGMGGNAVEPIESGSAIRDAVGQSEQLLSDLHSAIDVLEKRLDTVLLPVPPANPMTSASTAPPSPVMSHVRGRIAILNDGYVHGVQRLRDLMRRVEI